MLGMIGVAAHECGHINFSNFEKRRIYASGIREGILYPELPEPKNEEEKQVLGELQVCLEQKKEKELRVIRETAVCGIWRDCTKSHPVPWKMGHGTGRKHPADAGIRDGQPFHHEKCPPAVSEEQKSK